MTVRQLGFLYRCLCAAALWGAALCAQADYPDHTVSMLVPFPPGGVADALARPVAEALSRELKQSVVVENRPGAGGALGISQAALPGVPSLTQRGYKVQFTQWSALFVAAATPEPFVQSLRQAMRKLAADRALQQVLVAAGSPIEYQDAPEFDTYWKADAAVTTEAVRKIGKLE